jgi:hypothetical protein
VDPPETEWPEPEDFEPVDGGNSARQPSVPAAGASAPSTPTTPAVPSTPSVPSSARATAKRKSETVRVRPKKRQATQSASAVAKDETMMLAENVRLDRNWILRACSFSYGTVPAYQQFLVEKYPSLENTKRIAEVAQQLQHMLTRLGSIASYKSHWKKFAVGSSRGDITLMHYVGMGDRKRSFNRS